MAKQKRKYRLKKKVKILFLMICFILVMLGLYFVWPKKDELGKITLPSLREKGSHNFESGEYIFSKG